jgi:hypothetical protein
MVYSILQTTGTLKERYIENVMLRNAKMCCHDLKLRLKDCNRYYRICKNHQQKGHRETKTKLLHGQIANSHNTFIVHIRFYVIPRIGACVSKLVKCSMMRNILHKKIKQ